MQPPKEAIHHRHSLADQIFASIDQEFQLPRHRIVEGHRQIGSRSTARATASASMGSDLPLSRADSRLLAIKCGGHRFTGHGPPASKSRSRRPVTDRLSSTPQVRPVPKRVMAHRIASACPLLFARTVFSPSLRAPLSMATSVWVLVGIDTDHRHCYATSIP